MNSAKPKRFRVLYWVGLALFATSFFLNSVYDPSKRIWTVKPLRGYECAYTSVVFGAEGILDKVIPNRNSQDPLYLSIVLLGCGTINILFVLFALSAPFRPNNSMTRILQVLVPVLFPCCWIFFLAQWLEYRPREGYFVWTIGMILVLYAGPRYKEIESFRSPSRQHADNC